MDLEFGESTSIIDEAEELCSWYLRQVYMEKSYIPAP
jgi:hypothetical protein